MYKMTCDTCKNPHSLDFLLDKYNKPYQEKECIECKTLRFDGCFYEPLIPNTNIEITINQRKLLNKLIAWCFG